MVITIYYHYVWLRKRIKVDAGNCEVVMTVFIRGTKRFISLGKNRIHPTKRTGLTARIVITIIRPIFALRKSSFNERKTIV